MTTDSITELMDEKIASMMQDLDALKRAREILSGMNGMPAATADQSDLIAEKDRRIKSLIESTERRDATIAELQKQVDAAMKLVKGDDEPEPAPTPKASNRSPAANAIVKYVHEASGPVPMEEIRTMLSEEHDLDLGRGLGSTLSGLGRGGSIVKTSEGYVKGDPQEEPGNNGGPVNEAPAGPRTYVRVTETQLRDWLIANKSFTRKQLGDELGISDGGTNNKIKELLDKGMIHRIRPGFYEYVPPGDRKPGYQDPTHRRNVAREIDEKVGVGKGAPVRGVNNSHTKVMKRGGKSLVDKRRSARGIKIIQGKR